MQLIFFSEQPFYRNYSTLNFHTYKHCNFSRVCLLVKMASKTVTRSIISVQYNNINVVVKSVLKFLLTMKCHDWSVTVERTMAFIYL